jgi:hypothetical protein
MVHEVPTAIHNALKKEDCHTFDKRSLLPMNGNSALCGQSQAAAAKAPDGLFRQRTSSVPATDGPDSPDPGFARQPKQW